MSLFSVVPLPSSPSWFSPQLLTVPLLVRANASSYDDDIAVTSLRPLTETGLLLHAVPKQVSGPVKVPSPSSPPSLNPHAFTVPFFRRAYADSVPAAIAVTSLRPEILTGTSLNSVPSPAANWPAKLAPQAFTVPFLSSAYPENQPVAIAVTSLSPLTVTGSRLSELVVPIPSSPSKFSPHALTVPFFNNAKLNGVLVAIAVTSLRPGTSLGTSYDPLSLPLPRSPDCSNPQARTLPSFNSARL